MPKDFSAVSDSGWVTLAMSTWEFADQSKWFSLALQVDSVSLYLHVLSTSHQHKALWAYPVCCKLYPCQGYCQGIPKLHDCSQHVGSLHARDSRLPLLIAHSYRWGESKTWEWEYNFPRCTGRLQRALPANQGSYAFMWGLLQIPREGGFSAKHCEHAEEHEKTWYTLKKLNHLWARKKYKNTCA